MSRSEIAESYNNSIFSFLRNLHIAFHTDCAILDSHQYCRRAPFSPHPDQLLLLVEFLMMAILICARRYLVILLSCISLMVRDVEHLLMCLLAICISCLEKHLFRSSAHFLIEVLVFLLSSCRSCLYILKIKPLLVPSFANIFSHPEGRFIILFMVSFAVQKLVKLISPFCLVLLLFLLLGRLT